jgi:hypothetical protein
MEQKPTDNANNASVEGEATTAQTGESVLQDDVLAAGGLRKVSAYIRTEPSANAVRVKRSRQNSATNGAAQVNVLAPVGGHAIIKGLAKALQSGKTAQTAFEELLTAEVTAVNPDAAVIVSTRVELDNMARLSAKLACLQGLRRLIARWLGLI